LYASPIHWRPDRPPSPLSSPAGFAADVSERVGPFRTLGWAEATAALDAGLIDERAFLDDAQRAFDDRAEVILQRLDTKSWDLLVGEIDTLDRVQHVMWRLMDAAHPSYDRAAAAKFGETIERMYRRVDDFVGDVAARVGAETTVLVMSAYGSHGATRTFDLDRWLIEEGLGGKAAVTNAGGIILNAESRPLADHLAARLKAQFDPATHRPLITGVYKRDAVYNGVHVSNAPDLQVGLAPGYRLAHSSSVVADNPDRWSAEHVALDYASVPGLLISSRPTATTGPRVVDVAPTVLRYFGVPISKEIDGTPLF
jgi:predicted AlkP superfamily phosphohydrolase/phosphomutase